MKKPNCVACGKLVQNHYLNGNFCNECCMKAEKRRVERQLEHTKSKKKVIDS